MHAPADFKPRHVNIQSGCIKIIPDEKNTIFTYRAVSLPSALQPANLRKRKSRIVENFNDGWSFKPG